MMLSIVTTVFLAVLYGAQSSYGAPNGDVDLAAKVRDPCATIAGKNWVEPAAVRACFKSFKVNSTIKANVSAILSTIGQVLRN